MPRELEDVLDYFLPTAEAAETMPPKARATRPAALPILSLPIGDREVVRAAFAWNLAIEVARRGASATLLTPAVSETSALWPDPGRGPVGLEVVVSGARSLGELNRAALDLAVSRAADSNDSGMVLVRVPPEWLCDASEGRALLRWLLLFASTDRRDLAETYALAKQILLSNGETRVGITIHGARRVADAEHAFNHVANVSTRHLGRTPVSYGLLVDDLHVYRAIVARRPIGLEHPQSRAARALRDVARLVLDDARTLAIA